MLKTIFTILFAVSGIATGQQQQTQHPSITNDLLSKKKNLRKLQAYLAREQQAIKHQQSIENQVKREQQESLQRREAQQRHDRMSERGYHDPVVMTRNGGGGHLPKQLENPFISLNKPAGWTKREWNRDVWEAPVEVPKTLKPKDHIEHQLSATPRGSLRDVFSPSRNDSGLLPIDLEAPSVRSEKHSSIEVRSSLRGDTPIDPMPYLPELELIGSFDEVRQMMIDSLDQEMTQFVKSNKYYLDTLPRSEFIDSLMVHEADAWMEIGSKLIRDAQRKRTPEFIRKNKGRDRWGSPLISPSQKDRQHIMENAIFNNYEADTDATIVKSKPKRRKHSSEKSSSNDVLLSRENRKRIEGLMKEIKRTESPIGLDEIAKLRSAYHSNR